MKNTNRVAILNILSVILLRGITIITAPIFTTLLGDSGYGILNIYNIWVSAIAILFSLQVQGTLANARIEYPEAAQPAYQSSVMSLSVLTFGVLGSLVLIFRAPVAMLLQIPVLLIPFMLLQAFGTACVNFLSTKFVYEFKAGWNMLISVVTALLSLGLSVLLILAIPEQEPYLGRIMGISATYAVIGIPACIYVIWAGRSLWNPTYWRFCCYLALPLVFYNLSDLLLGQIDRVMLKIMMSDAIVGQYSAAYQIGNIMFLIFGALNNSWCPFFFEDRKQGNLQQERSKAENYLELYTVLSIGFVLLVREVYQGFFQAVYWSGTNLIPLFATSYYLNFLCTFPVNYEYYRKKTKVVSAVTISSSLSNVLLNYFLIQAMGMPGAVVATVISHALQLTAHHIYCRFIVGKAAYPFRAGLWGKYAVVYLLSLVLVYGTPNLWWLRWGLGACIGLWELRRIQKRKVLI